jgi:hypothetical protein
MLVGLRAVLVIGLCAVVIVGLRVVVFVGLCAIVSCRFLKPPRAGEVLSKFLTYSFMFILLRRRARRR